jgi:hypothetical protein
LAFNATTGSFYVRDLGYTLNTFLPNDGAAITGTGELNGPIAGPNTPPVFDKTPEAGLTINKDGSGGATAKANFGADANWTTWFNGQASGANLRYVAVASDRLGTSTGVNTFRQISSVSATKTAAAVSNGTIDNQTTNINGLSFAGASLSNTGTLSTALLTAALGSFINQGTTVAGTLTAALGSDANLFYFTRTAGTAVTGTTANKEAFANSEFTATINLATNGDFTYNLAAAPVSAVPLPGAAWLFGAGLMSLVSNRRRCRQQR